jgi:multimeric flavodoxin WrbA
MVIRVCGIVGGPKKNGNVDLLVTQILKGSESRGAEAQKIYLNDLSIKPCQSCGVDPRPRFCVFDDDMRIVYEALESCDAVVLGSPVYFDSVSAQTKLMIDRCNCLMPYVKQPDGTYAFERRAKKRKTGIFVAAAGTDQEFDTTMATVKGFFNWTNTELAEKLLYKHEDNQLGKVRTDKKTMQQALEIGIRLVHLFKKEKR